MHVTIKAPHEAMPQLSNFWGRYFSEIPTCTNPGCCRVAVAVDPFFPYLDDLNRCEMHVAEEESVGSVS